MCVCVCVCVCADNDKSFEERQEEEYLIQRKLDIVNQRNSIVDSMDEDRLRLETRIILSLKSQGEAAWITMAWGTAGDLSYWDRSLWVTKSKARLGTVLKLDWTRYWAQVILPWARSQQARREVWVSFMHIPTSHCLVTCHDLAIENVLFSSIQNGICVLREAHLCSTSSVRSFVNAAVETVHLKWP